MTEFWVAIAGPIASVVMGLGCLGIALGFGWRRSTDPQNVVTAVLVWLGYINISLAVFNLIPAFPLDGGRVLRSIVWAITKNQVRSTRTRERRIEPSVMRSASSEVGIKGENSRIRRAV